MRQRSDRLEVEVSIGDRVVDVRVAGEIDIATVAQFRSVLWAQPPRPLLRLDLSAVPVFSAAAIRTLVAAHLGVRARGGELVLVDPHPMILRVLHGTGLHRVIPVEDTPRVTLPAGRPPAEAPRTSRADQHVDVPAPTPPGDAVPFAAGPVRRSWAVTDVSRSRVPADRRPAPQGRTRPALPYRPLAAV
ncbi:anti-sigma factor antagonist [Micromonospora echinospora]|uniref:anti-sigma factor antagonist n=1 Tax=Micromonospora echinospora TaxID=1877 RepID=UPI00379480DB